MDKKTTIVYKEEEDKTYITSNVPKDMVKLLDKYPEEYIDFADEEELGNGNIRVKSIVLTIPGKAYNFTKVK